MSIEYKLDTAISADQFITLLKQSTLAERRPVDDRACMEGMLANSNLVVSAWQADTLVGIARSVTDFSYACYLSDLAVHQAYQRQGIGIRLLQITQAQLGPACRLILIAAPAASRYYDRLGFTHHERCWILERDDAIAG